MNSFKIVNNTRVLFGLDSLDYLKEEVSSLGPKILFHFGMSSIKKNGIYDEVMDILNTMDVEVVELGGVRPNPQLSLVLEGIEICKEKGITGILAVGGGSVIDSAKAIAAGVYVENIESYFMGARPVDKALPVGCILTIPAAGSESSKSSVVTVGNGLHKRSINSEVLYPKFAIINPKYFVTLDRYNTACGIADIYSHLLERYFTQTKNVSYTDHLLEASMVALQINARALINNLDDVDARAEVGFIGNLAHNGLLGSGRVEDWASHRIEHELSAKYDIAHGAGLAIVFPAWMKHVWKENPERFIRYANKVMGIEGEDDTTILKGIQALEQFFMDLYLPIRLHEAGIFIQNPEEIIENCYYQRPDSFGNFKPIYKEDMEAILKLAQ